MAIALNRPLPEQTGWNITILGIDINVQAFHTASLGIYDDWPFRDSPSGLKQESYHNALSILRGTHKITGCRNPKASRLDG